MARGLYVHVPFCARACPYCDFDFEVGRRPAVERYLAGLEREWAARGDRAGFETVYVGGGTPSLLGPAGLERLLAWIAARVDRTAVEEWTVELNPEHVEAELVETLVRAGVDRVSLGIQSFDAAGLVELGRMHDEARARAALLECQAAGLRTSVDLIVGWPSQTPEALARDLEVITAHGVDHVSVYALTIEPSTPWERLVRRGQRRLPDPDLQADRLLQVETTLEGRGFRHYEISSYARGDAEARHNTGYWTWHDYLGLGPSAASATFQADGGVQRHTNRRGLAAWLEAPGDGDDEGLARSEAAAEGLWTGLRRLDGFAPEPFCRRFGVDLAWIEGRLADAVARGNVERVDGRFRVAPGRWLWHDGIAASILAARA